MSRTKRKPYTGSKRFDPSCRNHGRCPWCEGNRAHAANRHAHNVEDWETDLGLLRYDIWAANEPLEGRA